MRLRHRFIKTKKQLKRVIESCKATRYCSFDFETNSPKEGSGKTQISRSGFQWEEDFPTIVGISFQPTCSYILPLGHKDSWFKDCWQDLLRLLSREVLEDKTIVKIAYNAKFEHKWLRRYGCDMKGIIHDPMLMKYLLDEERPNDLKSLSAMYYPEYSGYENEVQSLVKANGGWGNVPIKELGRYCGADCQLTLSISNILEKKLIKNKFYNIYRNLYMMMHRCLLDTEINGMRVDRQYLMDIIKTTKKEIEDNQMSLQNHPVVKRYFLKTKKKALKKLIKNTQREIKHIRKGKIPSANEASKKRMITAREKKLSSYVAKEFVTKKDREMFEGGVNFNSPKQLIDLLFISPHGFQFEVVKYTQHKETKQDTDTPSTAEDVLEILKTRDDSGFMQRLLDHRGFTKLYSTYMIGMRDKLTPNDRVHTGYLMHGTVTGRLSSRNPNLQNIPRDTTSSTVKNMFVPPPGHLILEVDYSQAELRVLAEMAGDDAMIDIFKRGYNIHLATGLKLVNKMDSYDLANRARKDANHPEHVKWKKIHKRGKVTNFSILYGQSKYATAEDLSTPEDPVTPAEAEQFKQDWFDRFPQVQQWMESQYQFLHEEGFVYNIFGQKRRLPDVWSDNDGKYNKALRDCINAPIQGGSAHFTNFSNVILWRMIKQGKFNMLFSCYTVHDSIGFYIKPHLIHKYVPQLVKICSNPQTQKWFGFQMKKVNMKVSIEVGKTWGTLDEYNENTNYKTWI